MLKRHKKRSVGRFLHDRHMGIQYITFIRRHVYEDFCFSHQWLHCFYVYMHWYLHALRDTAKLSSVSNEKDSLIYKDWYNFVNGTIFLHLICPEIALMSFIRGSSTSSAGSLLFLYLMSLYLTCVAVDIHEKDGTDLKIAVKGRLFALRSNRILLEFICMLFKRTLKSVWRGLKLNRW